MRGSIKKRYNGSYSLIFDLGYETDPVTGKRKRRLKWETFRPAPGTSAREGRKQAEAKLRERVSAIDTGTFAEPSKVTVVEYLRDWVEKCIKPPLRAPETYRVYRGFINKHIASAPIALVRLQKLRGSDLERYYATLKRSPSTIASHHAMLSGALKKAVKDHLLVRNPAADVDARPKVSKDHEDAKRHCWSASEAAAFLRVATESRSGRTGDGAGQEAKAADAQAAAFFALALDSGARRGELHGFRWTDIDLDAGQVRIERQLYKPGPKPDFGPTKGKDGRTVALGAETVALLRAHKVSQAALKLRNRTTYVDLGLVFARTERWPGVELGEALPSAPLASREFARLTAAAGVRRIKFHGLRHTSATLLLRAGVPPHVVARRLGHKEVTTTLETYAHVLPDMSADAAAKLAAVLHG